jgi:hypothetical protein
MNKEQWSAHVRMMYTLLKASTCHVVATDTLWRELYEEMCPPWLTREFEQLQEYINDAEEQYEQV